jgi:hypothetical protein
MGLYGVHGREPGTLAVMTRFDLMLYSEELRSLEEAQDGGSIGT